MMPLGRPMQREHRQHWLLRTRVTPGRPKRGADQGFLDDAGHALVGPEVRVRVRARVRVRVRVRVRIGLG